MSTHKDRLAALRDQLSRDRLDGFVVPLTDEHMSEYVGAYAQRLAWLTGFQGSAGTAAVLPQEAAIFTDGRYTLQVREQVSGEDWQYVAVPDTSVAGWLGAHAEGRRADRLRIPGSAPAPGWRRRAALAKVGAELVAVDTNPVDAVWPDRPQPSDAPLAVQSDAAAGRSSPPSARTSPTGWARWAPTRW
ncbi:aminopeptidase P family N-terminal domain-containing protein [Sphingomonas sp. MMS24-JH45]